MPALRTSCALKTRPVTLAVSKDLKGSFKGDIDIDRNVDVEVEVDVDKGMYFGCFKGFPKSVQVLFNGIEVLLVLTLIVLKLQSRESPYDSPRWHAWVLLAKALVAHMIFV